MQLHVPATHRMFGHQDSSLLQPFHRPSADVPQPAVVCQPVLTYHNKADLHVIINYMKIHVITCNCLQIFTWHLHPFTCVLRVNYNLLTSQLLLNYWNWNLIWKLAYILHKTLKFNIYITQTVHQGYNYKPFTIWLHTMLMQLHALHVHVFIM